ncbi:MAG: hypothetical protein LUG13_03685 [Oscillospiraceae bacterium]|nr:hypothetical protein [Oscillospiraceae bacterium]
MQTKDTTSVIYLDLLQPNEGDGGEKTPFHRLESALRALKGNPANSCELVVMSTIPVQSPLILSAETLGQHLIIKRGERCTDALFDVVSSGDMVLGCGVTLDGNRDYFKKNNTTTGPLVRVGTNGKLRMEEGSMLRNNYAVFGSGVELSGGSFVLCGGDITKCEATEYGGAVAVTAGKMTMISGDISYNVAPKGSGVYLRGELDIAPDYQVPFRLTDRVYLENGRTLHLLSQITGIYDTIPVVCEATNAPRVNLAVCANNMIATASITMEKIFNAGEGTERKLFYHDNLVYLQPRDNAQH